MKSKPQGLVLNKFFKTLRQKKVILAIVFGFLIVSVAAALFLSSQKDNSIKLVFTSEGSRFKANFILPDKSRNDFEYVLDSINIPRTILNGVAFELESTASSSLAFALPVEADLEIKEKEIRYFGFHNYPQSRKIDLETVVIVIFKPEKIDFGRLGNLEFENTVTPSYKREKFANDTDVHFVKLNSSKNLSAAIFEKDGWAYLIFSEESPQEAIDFYLQKPGDFIEFPNIDEKSASFIIWFRNTGNYTATREFYRLLFGQNLENVNTLEKIDEARFFLLGNTFSGLIKFK
ncbi:MAG: hypothetical protein UT92_C0006G0005 [Candidatus Curtissbacteria bacterium GW2011_GWA1_40_24]|uniref:Uncharacterized protein n=1 Tax=Candidatus Curtissbacteria bacterium GW2011_GWA1_40_24 TaxID=1618406 RepID=A0A0G0UY93_9BACT|nr:MAG: hypothetical protein UT92_C0006G0005 [Candidatus Curtissbacteria bacterium GW2011_GWA1_40_24]